MRTRPSLSGVAHAVAALACALLAPTTGGVAQTLDPLVVRGPDGASVSLPVDRLRGYATVSQTVLERLGWSVGGDSGVLRATMGDGGPVVEFSAGSPLFRWNEEVLQLVDVAFARGGSIHVPLQFVLDFLPVRLAEIYAYPREDGALEILDALLWARLAPDAGPAPAESGPAPPSEDDPDPDDPVGAEGRPQPPEAEAPTVSDEPPKRVVIIDPGHGGRDPGSVGSGGRREKDIALAIGRALARELRKDDELEVHLTRDRDVLVPLWERGEQATAWKGERPGVFVSIHANALPGRPSIRGFETYFLSEARSDHERRVAANENAPLRLERAEGEAGPENPDLSFILRELRNLDHQHWSALLAEGVQLELETMHPGPNRGVKQGPFAVITNALMPAVLIEVGFVTNRAEERALSRGEFQSELAQAIARAIRGFFQRYPPGQGSAVPGSRR